MAQVKVGKVAMYIRLPDEIVAWLERQAAYRGTTFSGEIGSAVRARMEREAQEARADRSPAGE
jgi:hypothetical protein